MCIATIALASLLVILTLTTSYAILSSPVAVEASRDSPSMKVALNTTTINMDGVFDSWIFVTNPSRNMDTSGSTPGWRLPVHVVTCNNLTVVYRLPNGTVVDGGTFSPGDGFLEYRWNPIVNPMENSMVFFIGFGTWEMPGRYAFTYTLNVTYEGQNYLLQDTFQINVRS